jgi:hypothetical protein
MTPPSPRPGPEAVPLIKAMDELDQVTFPNAELVGDIERALSGGELPDRKAVMQAVVAEIRVRDRGQIQPVFRVPVFRPPYGLVPL